MTAQTEMTNPESGLLQLCCQQNVVTLCLMLVSLANNVPTLCLPSAWSSSWASSFISIDLCQLFSTVVHHESLQQQQQLLVSQPEAEAEADAEECPPEWWKLPWPSP